MTIYDLILRLQQEVMKGNGDKLFCVEAGCLCPAKMTIEQCQADGERMMIKFRNGDGE